MIAAVIEKLWRTLRKTDFSLHNSFGHCWMRATEPAGQVCAAGIHLRHASAICVPAPPLNRYQPDKLESERLPRLVSVYAIALFDSLRNVYLEHSAKVFQKWFSFKVVCLFFDAVRQCYLKWVTKNYVLIGKMAAILLWQSWVFVVTGSSISRKHITFPGVVTISLNFWIQNSHHIVDRSRLQGQ